MKVETALFNIECSKEGGTTYTASLNSCFDYLYFIFNYIYIYMFMCMCEYVHENESVGTHKG